MKLLKESVAVKAMSHFACMGKPGTSNVLCATAVLVTVYYATSL